MQEAASYLSSLPRGGSPDKVLKKHQELFQ